MGTLAIDIQNLPTLDEIESLIVARRQEIAELRKLKSLASLREKAEQSVVPEPHKPPDEEVDDVQKE